MSENNKPVVESFQLDHTKVKAPYVRYIDTQTGSNGDVISNYDLRLVQPNENAIPDTSTARRSGAAPDSTC